MKESRIKDIGRTKTYWKSDTDHEGLLAMAMVDSGKAKSKKMKNLGISIII